ncbi:MAG: DNA polymerase I, partial [Deltaproteobacteria bacterium]|nr:DNA polymerase I [Deltaproteobacteria bacterium]
MGFVMVKQVQRLFLIDGSALAYRSYFAFIRNPLINSKGENTSAIFGFMNSLFLLMEKEKPDLLAIVFDTPEPTFRHKRFAEYKATRQKMPDEMASQLSRLFGVLRATKIPILELPGYEADDVMGTLALRACSQGMEAYLVSGDKDFMQLVRTGIKIYNPRRAGAEVEVLDELGVEEKFGVPPLLVTDVLGLMGDSSDNVPGVHGIGPKTAMGLVKEFGGLEEIYKDILKIKSPKLKANLEAHLDEAFLSKELVTIDTSAPIEISWQDLMVKPMDTAALKDHFKDLEFFSLFKYLEPEKAAEDVQYYAVDSKAKLEDLINLLKQSRWFSFDLETTSLFPMEAEIVGFSFSVKEKEAFYIPVNLGTFGANEEEFVLEKLKPIYEDEVIKKCGQNTKYDTLILKRYGVEVRGITFDPMIADYLINPSGRQHNLDTLSLEYLDHKKIPTSELIGLGKKQISMREVPLEQISHYACEDADITLRLTNLLKPKLVEDGLEELFYKVEMPLSGVLMTMEMNGVHIDRGMLQVMSRRIEERLSQLEENIHKLAGQRFTINSPKQLSTILFEKLKLPVIKKTKTGYSTDVEVLKELAQYDPLPKELLEYRQLMKLKSTYVDA